MRVRAPVARDRNEPDRSADERSVRACLDAAILRSPRNNIRALTLVVFILLLQVLGLLPTQAQAAEGEPCSIVQQKLEEVTRLRGLAATRPVPCAVESRAQVEEFLRNTIARRLPPQKLEHEQAVYRAVGVVPDDFDYPRGLLNLYMSQIGGYYDPESKRFIMADWMPAHVQAVIARHELTHALQDQHYNLEAFIDPKMENGDELLARSSLLEGDATAVMLDIERGIKGMAPLSSERSVKAYMEGQARSLAAAAELEDSPPALRDLVLFPYTHGLRFVHELLRRDGYSEVDRAFKRAPQSTREILHERDFIDRRFSLAVPAVHELRGAAAGQTPSYTDTLGEFLIRAVLEAQKETRGDAARAAQGWVGDRVGLFPRANGETVVSWMISWESENDAREFALAYRKLLKARYGKAPTTGRIELSPTKAASIEVSGKRVSVVFWCR